MGASRAFQSRFKVLKEKMEQLRELQTAVQAFWNPPDAYACGQCDKRSEKSSGQRPLQVSAEGLGSAKRCSHGPGLETEGIPLRKASRLRLRRAGGTLGRAGGPCSSRPCQAAPPTTKQDEGNVKTKRGKHAAARETTSPRVPPPAPASCPSHDGCPAAPWRKPRRR